jgi:hypothetical protein
MAIAQVASDAARAVDPHLSLSHHLSIRAGQPGGFIDLHFASC